MVFFVCPFIDYFKMTESYIRFVSIIYSAGFRCLGVHRATLTRGPIFLQTIFFKMDFCAYAIMAILNLKAFCFKRFQT